ncbi:MAG: glucan biosynthesis protein, partial [Synergistota bacterium]|nr:glucan biosynthesis protein [Synergistota bacterium]
MNKRYLALIAAAAAFAFSFNALYALVAGAQTSQDKANESHPLTLEALEAQVLEKARQLALEPYQEPSEKAPDFLKGLTYDQWRDIRF